MKKVVLSIAVCLGLLNSAEAKELNLRVPLGVPNTEGVLEKGVAQMHSVPITDEEMASYRKVVDGISKQFQIELCFNEQEIVTSKKYLDTKLSLYLGLKQHFDSIKSLKQILFAYTKLYNILGSNKELQAVTRKNLLENGIHNDETIIQFLLLISENIKDFSDMPVDTDDETKLGEYFFNKYKSPEETWDEPLFRWFMRKRLGYQIEEVAIYMLAQSRADLIRAIDDPGEDIRCFIAGIDSYFRYAFKTVFGIEPSVNIIDATKVTRVWSGDVTGPYADRIRGFIYASVEDFQKDRNGFCHEVIHEAMHLSFGGIEDYMLEEAVIEYLIEKMFSEAPSIDFPYTVYSKGYRELELSLKFLCQCLPTIENVIIDFFKNFDEAWLKDKLRQALLNEDILGKIRSRADVSLEIASFIDNLRRYLKSEDVNNRPVFSVHNHRRCL